MAAQQSDRKPQFFSADCLIIFHLKIGSFNFFSVELRPRFLRKTTTEQWPGLEIDFSLREIKYIIIQVKGVFFWDDFETFGILEFADIEAFENTNPKEYSVFQKSVPYVNKNKFRKYLF